MDFVRALGPLALDHRSRRVSELLLRTAEEVYRELGLPFRPRWTSTFLLVDQEGPVPVTEIAQRLRLTHPAVIAITNEMRDAGLVDETRDEGDGRRRLIALTPTGRRLKPRLRKVWDQIATVQRRRFEAAGCNIVPVLDRFEDEAARSSMSGEVVAKLRRQSSRQLATRMAGVLAAVGLFAGSRPVQAQSAGGQLNREVIGVVSRHLREGYVDETAGRVAAESLEARLRSGSFDHSSPQALAERVTALLLRLTRDPHLGLHYQPSVPASAAPPPPASSDRAPAAPAGSGAELGFCRAEILPGAIGYLNLCGFSGAPEALAFADSVLAGMAHVAALIIDLRENRGGGPEMVRHLSTYMFNHRTHLVSTFIRGIPAPRERWTLENVPGPRFAEVPVYLLTSRSTISAAESFAFGLRINRKVTIVGEPTAGGGHFGESIDLPGGFSMFLPVGRTFDPRTGQGWEASGLKPDVMVPSPRALERAIEMIRR
jgi:DNA-binding MarR family transcriptional regulator